MKYTWVMFDRDIEKTIKKIKPNSFDIIVGVSKGGLVLAIKLANMFNLPLYIVETSSYEDKKQKELKIKYHFYGEDIVNKKILLVDDICDSGKTLGTLKAGIVKVEGVELTTLSLFYKPRKSVFKPNYYFHSVTNKTWVNFPWEK